MKAHEDLASKQGVVARTVAYACRRYGLGSHEAEELAAAVRRKLAGNDDALLNGTDGRSSFATFVNVLVQRLALGYRSRSAPERSAAALSAAIARMPDDARLILQLHLEEGVTAGQIARMLQIDPEVLDLRLKQYTRHLREQLEPGSAAIPRPAPAAALN